MAKYAQQFSACLRKRKVDLSGQCLADSLLDADVGGEFCGEFFGLKDKAPSDVLTASIGRKHCASGLNVLVTSRSADDVSSECRSCDSEKRIYRNIDDKWTIP